MGDQANRTILVVEDEKEMLQMVSDYLLALGYRVLQAEEGREAMKLFHREAPDLVVLDVMLPLIDGFEIIRKIRGFSSVPVIMLTARAEESDRLMGLELGADDYVIKPFSIRELAARIRTVLRRVSPIEEEQKLQGLIKLSDLVLNREKRTLSRSGKMVDLTAVQFDLLAGMMEHPGKVFTRSDLLALSGTALTEAYERTIDAHIKNIRKALEIDPQNPQYILTVRGVGYKVSDNITSPREDPLL
jgi:DNA-binding response OmpR family regulator